MKLLVTSDTHGNTPLLFHACEMALPCDAVVHLGDGNREAEMLAHAFDITVITVAGNCDIHSSAPRERIWECGGQRLFLTHGDLYGVKNGFQMLERRGIEVEASAVLFGHSHLATTATLSGIRFINPGTLTRHARRRTVAIMDVTSSGITTILTDITYLNP